MVRGAGSIPLVRVFGIRIGVHPSWFVVLFVFIFFLNSTFRDTLGSSSSTAYITAVAAALLFFTSIVLHELGHALVAQRLGIGIAGIDLWLFGGIAKMTRNADSPGEEFKVAVAGPVVTLVIVALCAVAGIAVGGAQAFMDGVTLKRGAGLSAATLLLAWLATINAGLLVFNLIPAFPLDGGRIARALAWKRTGDRLRATGIAARLGQIFSYILIGMGVLLAIQGILWGLWSVAMGFFLGQAARAEAVQTVFSERMRSVKVADIMDPEPVSVPAELSVGRARDEFFLRYGWPWFPVTDAAGRFVGLLRSEQVDLTQHAQEGSGALVADVMEPDHGEWRIGADAPLEALLASAPLRSGGALMAVDANGVLRGVVTLEQVRRALQAATTPPTQPS